MGEKVVAGGMAHDIGEEAQCSDHPDRSNPSGICAACLQEKLGKLVSSSKSSDPFFSNLTPPSFSSPPSFWSFLTLSSDVAKRRSIKYRAAAKEEEACATVEGSPSESQGSSSSGRKVARSRSVGCGSRSFSGDFLERISNGLGDCALRRAESHREAKPKLSGDDYSKQRRFKERVKCRGIFAGLGAMPFSNYWLSAATANSGDFEEAGSLQAAKRGGRNRSWAWAFASPMRAFKPAGSGEGSRSSVFIAAGESVASRSARNGSVVAVGSM
ncbi:hypothetical protein KSP40_PGU010085 [Platanthera guangdongensis]|uniref:Uncharacterized protein n=1 Tax=Platanthera guangdongensis TaxID=2320717 RepID=A0ABR2LL42_9ASPA